MEENFGAELLNVVISVVSFIIGFLTKKYKKTK